ncbi:MAG: glycosyltransferase family 39 protein [Candidatus Goldbacteria bacterium]|nr:glycosyltransferase family 39 protein [Candidatus Goldiibacteriota bacterium]
MKKLIITLFIIHFSTRFIFILWNGFYNNYKLQPDSIWLVEFGLKNAANLNFNFELPRFVVSPLFPSLVGMLNIVFGKNWDVLLIIIQLLLSSLSGVYIYKIGALLFNNKVGIISSFIFSIFPHTLWYTNTFSQECIFQILFILSIYYLIKSIKKNSSYFVLLSSVFFSLSYLTKSHILLFLIFIPIIYFHFYGLKKQTFVYSFLFVAISFIFSIPYGTYTLKNHQQYILSSNGAGYQFYLGNTEAGYKTIVDPPDRHTYEFKKLQDITNTAGYFNGSQKYYDSILSLPQKEKQLIFFKEGINWIKSNPKKFIELKLYNIVFFLIPGVSWRHYNFSIWFFSFLSSLPIYLSAYYAMFKLLKNKNKNIIFLFYIFISMLMFSLVWYVQNRFRTITIEPFYIIYAAYVFTHVIEKKIPALNKRLTRMIGDEISK